MKLSNGEKDDLDPDHPRSQSNDLYYLPTKTIILNKVVWAIFHDFLYFELDHYSFQKCCL